MKYFDFKKRYVVGFTLFFLLIFWSLNIATSHGSSFTESLHSTGKGMQYWYELGFMKITKIPYDQLVCKNCHVKTCEACHTKIDKDTPTNTAKDMKTCLKCHSRAGLTFKLGKEKKSLDVHIAADMVCVDCHTLKDIHGDGVSYNSKRDEGAVKASCEECHADRKNSYSHKVHNNKVDCAACHVENTTACLNCHFDTFLKTGERKGNFFPMQDWLLLINYNGKVTSGTAMTLVYNNKKYIAYMPYFTHAVQKKGRNCSECHANSAVKLIKEGKSIPMMVFKDNKVVPWKGVVPVIPNKLDWVFLNKDGNRWSLIKNEEAPTIQFDSYGKPVTDEQMEKLTKPQK